MMFEVASLSLCRELYELSGWNDKDKYFQSTDGKTFTMLTYKETMRKVSFNIAGYAEFTPAYTLGYLLRKLQSLSDEPDEPNIRLDFGNRKPGVEWYARCSLSFEKDCGAHADTPENAATKLAIELIKQHIITPREGGGNDDN